MSHQEILACFARGNFTRSHQVNLTCKMLFVTKPDIFWIPCKLRVCKKTAWMLIICTVVIHTILWKFANLRLTSPSGPIIYTAILWLNWKNDRKKDSVCSSFLHTQWKKMSNSISWVPLSPMTFFHIGFPLWNVGIRSI